MIEDGSWRRLLNADWLWAVGYCLVTMCDWLLVTAQRLLHIGYALLAIGCWRFATRDWQLALAIGYWFLRGCWRLANGYSSLAIGY